MNRSSDSGVLLISTIIFFFLISLTESFYLPGVAPRDFQRGDPLQVKVNKLSSTKTQLPYEYYYLNYCKPKHVTNSAENLGEVLRGDRIENSVYTFHMREELPCQAGCRVKLDAGTAKKFKEKIDDEYRVNMILDNLPVAVLRQRRDGSQSTTYEHGFRVGFKGNYAGSKEEKYFINNHLSFRVMYHKDLETDSARIVGFEVTPNSINHEYKDWDEKNPQLTTCNQNTKNIIQGSTVPQEVDTDKEVVFTYDVTFKESDIKWASRWDTYLLMNDDQIHWFSIINSLMIVLFLSGMVAMIMMRTLYRDIANYNQLDTQDEAQEETGWKLVHGDVFRAPEYSGLLSVYVGTGVQLFGMTLVTMIFASLGFLSPSNRGGLMTAMVLLWVFMGLFGGYASARIYKMFKGTEWKKNTLKTSFMFPGVLFAIFFVLNALIWGEKSSGAVPFGTMIALVCLWFGISVPLVFVGSYLGFKKPAIEDPVKTNKIPRQVPEQAWYMQPVFSILIGGILPFGAVFIELFFILTSIWLNQFYYIFGFLFIVFVILIITCAEITVVLCYFQLCSEDYHWWWRAYLTAGSSALYLFLYSIFYFFTKLEITKPVSGILYFGYMLIASYAFFVLTGTIGFYACLWWKTKKKKKWAASNSQQQQDYSDSLQLFEKLKETEKERINKLEELDRKANVQLERQLVMASNWSRTLLTIQQKLKGTEWDPEHSHKIDYSDFVALLNSNNVKFMEYSNYGQTVSVILPYYKEGESKSESKRDVVFRRHIVDRMPVDSWNDVWQKLHQQLVNVDVLNVNTVPSEVYTSVATIVVWSMRLALAIGLYVWIDNMMRPIYAKLIPCDLGTPPKKTRQPIKNQALGSLGESRAKFISAEETTGVSFDDFAGQEYIKRELQEIVRILKNDEEFQNKGIYCPKGVLLHGPPGTGKTLLAKAIAGEAGLPFFAANGTDFVEMFVGVAASRVKDLFNSSRSFAPSIIFIDEIDAIGSKRGGPDIGGGGAEREQGLLQILTEMDGFKESTSQVLVIGATNRLDILDPALLRKGRFDKIIRVGLPSKDGRFAILKVHAKNKFFRSEEEKETLLLEIAEKTEDFTGAELQNILNEAGILTARKDLDYIGREELLEALKRQKGTFETGQEDRSEVPEELRLRLAYREAAVSVLACYFPDPHRPFLGTDINSVKSQSNMRYADISGRVFKRKADYVNSIVRACAPRVIEEEMFGVDNLCWISAKATLEASVLAEDLILQSGMTAFGKAYYRKQHDLVPNLAAKLEALKDEYMRFAMEKCYAILREYYSAVEEITDILLEKGEIEADEIRSIYESTPRISQPSVTSVDEYAALIYAGRWGIHGASLPGRATFAPGNVGFATFGAPRPMETQVVSDDTWKLVDKIWETRVQEIKDGAIKETEAEKERPRVLIASHFL